MKRRITAINYCVAFFQSIGAMFNNFGKIVHRLCINEPLAEYQPQWFWWLEVLGSYDNRDFTPSTYDEIKRAFRKKETTTTCIQYFLSVPPWQRELLQPTKSPVTKWNRSLSVENSDPFVTSVKTNAIVNSCCEFFQSIGVMFLYKFRRLYKLVLVRMPATMVSGTRPT